MALTREDLQAISELMNPIREDITGIKGEMAEMNVRLDNLQNQQNVFEHMLAKMSNQIDETEIQVRSVRLKMDQEISRNIQLLAENHINIVNKLNQAIHVQDILEVLEIWNRFLSTSAYTCDPELIFP